MAALFYLTRDMADRKLLSKEMLLAERFLKLSLDFMTPMHSEDTRAVLQTLIGCTLKERGLMQAAENEFRNGLLAVEATRKRAMQMLSKDPIMLESVQTQVDQKFSAPEAIASLELAGILAQTGRIAEASSRLHTAIKSLQEYRAILVRKMTVEEVQSRKSDRQYRWSSLLDLPASEKLALIDRCLFEADGLRDSIEGDA